MLTKLFPCTFTQARYMPVVLKGRAIFPARSTAINPPVPPSRPILSITVWAASVTRHPPIFQERGEIVGRDGADEKFAVPGGGHGARRVVRVSAGADDRRVADPAWSLVRVSAGRSCGREVACSIEGNSAHGSVAILIGQRGGRANALQRLPALFREEVFLVDDLVA
jgi:hypothetical protein